VDVERASWSCDSAVSPATVEREWAMAKAWLHRRLSPRE